MSLRSSAYADAPRTENNDARRKTLRYILPLHVFCVTAARILWAPSTAWTFYH